VDDPDLKVVNENHNAGSPVGSSAANAVHLSVQPEADGSYLVDAISTISR
jgi:hypothetical protein